MTIQERLKYAREKAKLTGAQVRERSQIGESSLSDFENGNREPSLSQLQALADVYRRPISFFFSTAPISQELVLWRERPEHNPEEVESLFLKLCEQYHNLELWADEKPPICLPIFDNNTIASTYTYRDAERLAKRVRDSLQLGDRPARVLSSVLEENCAVKIFHLDFEPTGTAASAVSDTFGAAILLNSRNTRWRRNFDLAHELFHLLTWRFFRPNVSTTPERQEVCDNEEKLAQCFASNLLMPSEATRTAIDEHLKEGSISFEALFDIARQFDVSVEALLWRMKTIYSIPHETIINDIKRMKDLVPLFEKRDEAPPSRWPDRYHALAVKALRRGELSIGRFAEYLEISRREAQRYIEQEVSHDEEIQLTSA